MSDIKNKNIEVDSSEGMFIRVPVSLLSIYITIALQFIGVCFMSGVVWTKLDYQSRSIDELKISVSNASGDRWTKTDHDKYSLDIVNKLNKNEQRIYELEKQFFSAIKNNTIKGDYNGKSGL